MAWGISKRRILFHAIAWLVFISYEIAVTLQMGVKAGFVEFASFYILNIVLFYFNAHVVFWFAFTTRKPFLALPFLLAIELSLYTLMSVALGVLIYKEQTHWSKLSLTYSDFVKEIWRGIYFIGLSTAYWFALRTIAANKKADQFKILKLRAERETIEAERNLEKSQNAYLKAQINPHMLFNTLNFIYNSVDEIAPDAGKGILLLSDIMRYALSEVGDDGKVELWKEVEQIKRYILLNQLRFNNRLIINTDIQIDENAPYRIPPLLLLTFIENIFQHGDMTNPASPALISLHCKEQLLHLHTSNLISRKAKTKSHHIGINNARTRLENHYQPDDFNITVVDDGIEFMLDLTVRL